MQVKEAGARWVLDKADPKVPQSVILSPPVYGLIFLHSAVLWGLWKNEWR